MKVPNEEIARVLNAMARVKAYRHPRSGRGISQDTALKFRIIDRKLRQAHKDYVDQNNELVQRHGVLRNKEVPGNYHVPKDCKGWSPFQKESRELRETSVELSDTLLIKLSELQVRDDEDEWEAMEEGAIADLGPILEEPKPPEESGDAAPKKPPKPKRAKKPRPE